ncbi:hypothetical protein AVEN_6048-1 [Araneus ventricosus]|uniref:Uncharacterized protein n=1 Tax=Araneus ventricosus TaxID=182803 RepID=A0A4Y2G273_ARAVE|nr:hypothetical protein AVEN_6048-1 [Araneus ventricosus]
MIIEVSPWLCHRMSMSFISMAISWYAYGYILVCLWLYHGMSMAIDGGTCMKIPRIYYRHLLSLIDCLLFFHVASWSSSSSSWDSSVLSELLESLDGAWLGHRLLPESLVDHVPY